MGIISTVEIKEGVYLALAAIRENKLRAGLTILGVLIGVASVIGMASIIAGLDKMVQREIDSFGENTVYVTKFAPGVDHDDLSDEERNRRAINVEAADLIRELCPSIKEVAPQAIYQTFSGLVVKYKDKQAKHPYIRATVPEFQTVRGRFAERGRFLNVYDVERRSMVVVLASDVSEALFPEENPIGKFIRINAQQYQVIGVLERKPPFMGGSDNDFIIMPLTTFEKAFPSRWEHRLSIIASARSRLLMPQAIEEVTSIMRRVRGLRYDQENDFAVWTQEQLKEMTDNITKYIYVAMIVISSVGLMVGGVGVMNIMLVSVTERTREIGVRKAIGARRLNILIQFLTEAMTLSGSGGVIGIFAGVFLAFLAKLIFSMPFTVSIIWMIIGFTVSVMVGLVAGIYPAYKAARVDPIISLRYE